MDREVGPAHKYDITQVSTMLTGGREAMRELRRWSRQSRIEGVAQREPEAMYRFTAQGVLEAWSLWAAREGLDPQTMPEAVRSLKDRADGSPRVAVVSAPPADGRMTTITVEVPPWIAVRVVTVAA